MKFRTEIKVDKQFELNPEDRVLAIGSCFADRMGSILAGLDLDCDVNPFGVLYNPLSISKLIEKSLNPEITFPDWFEKNGHWMNLMYHGNISSTDKGTAVNLAEEAHSVTKTYLQDASLLIVTFGTAFTYFLKETGDAVANCHRLPADDFERKILSPEEIISIWEPLLENLKVQNSDLNIVLTVSPVRHVRDSLVENSLSKSVLKVAVNKLCESERVHYFPSYEIMMDDLRDYRFYEENLVQPNSQAVSYIKEKFEEFCFTEEMTDYCSDSEKLKKRLSHKIMKQGPEAEKFAEETEKQLLLFTEKYPFSKITKR